ncbi:MAG: ATP-binding protein [Simkania negevensis]|nr:ATP-binding protein [Simkania negevensis]
MKKLSIGIQTIDKVIGNGYVYVDKTEYARKLITSGKHYLLPRPRRFGKSLFLSTLKAIFSGNKELFKECHIYASSYEWQKHPIIHLDFTKIPTTSPKQLEIGLAETLQMIAKSYGVDIAGSSLQLCLSSLVENLSKINKIVVLVDEYDKPLIDNLAHIEVAEANRELLKSFFATLKGLDEHLRFVFITGVSKFSQVSLFSGFNNLKDITIHPDYASMLGYTEREISQFFSSHIQKIVEERTKNGEKVNERQIIEEMRKWYNGYKFSSEGTPVYNPHSTLSFLDTGTAQSYWFRTGTPSFLIDQIRKVPQSAVQLSGIMATATELLDILDLNRMNLKALMWQTGYLTIQKYDSTTKLYILDFPNQEVRQAFFESLLQEFAEVSPSNVLMHGLECRKDLESYHLNLFFARIKTFFAKVPYTLHKNAKEGFYHALFLSFLEGMGIKTQAEEQTNIGRIDLVVEIAKITYIFEFKINRKADDALKQIETKKYKEKYSQDGREIAVVGVNFDSTLRNISDWSGEVYSSTGQTKMTLHS